MYYLFYILLALALAFFSIVSAGHALINKRDPRSSVGWIITCLVFPLVGPLAYWGMGVNRIYSRARRWHRRGKPAPRLQHPEAPQVVAPLPEELRFLRELRVLSDRVVSSPLSPGNAIEPLENGEDAYPAMLEAIAAAKRSVHLCTYIFDGDETGRRFVHELKEAVQRGVVVRVIVDSLGEKYSRTTAAELLKGTGVRFARFLPLRPGGYLNLRNHRKILVVDGTLGFTGGMNIGDRHLSRSGERYVRDLHFRVVGPVVTDLEATFLDDWRFATGELLQAPLYPQELPGRALVRAVSDGPDKEFRKLNWIILGAISCARQRVMIVTPYFIPDRALISALVTAALRGVAVVLVLPGKNNLPFVQWATRAYLWELLQHGIRVYLQPPPFVHTKFMTVDGSWSLIGSANLDPRSLRLNFELNLEVYDVRFAQLLEHHCIQAMAGSHQTTLKEVDSRPLPTKLRDGAAKLFSPYL
ncbi:cardiolipin synthase [Geomonas sp. RF6]|uniref:cardiolipin synthase n=1 Tax=Geomonas sp. RF6 TaxID=2897342 RepID=UPI001E3A4E3F|nr:cardiolipin synthase [Geomonas sp. RF6]UFS71806.1 cardiolipin synthase [Geomonas sp. RF6]